MIQDFRMLVPVALALMVAGVVCPLCGVGSAEAAEGAAAVSAQSGDTATARLHISGMTCATCPVTARVALQKIPGVHSAKVTLDDSLGVVRYNPAKATPAGIAAELARRTGYATTVLPPVAKTGRAGSTPKPPRAR